MSVPRTPPALHLLRTLPALLLLLVAATCYAKEPPLRIPLAPLGFEPLNPGAMTAGGSMSTVQFIDEQHLLVTFVVHRLMKRLPDCLPDDQDHLIEAVVVDLPSGKAIARTQWRVHDSGQYLWNLGHGRFMLRLHDSFSTFVPLANLATRDPFVEQPLLASKRLMVVVQLSPDRDLLTVETVERARGIINGDPHDEPAFTHTQINFYRLVEPARPTDRVFLQPAGLAVSDTPISVSLTSAGYIEVSQESHDSWLFDFDPYVGKHVELSPFDTSCRPHPFFVSASEFVAFGCRGGDDRMMIGGFNMSGEQMWQQNFSEPHAFPNFAAVPAAGRFALSRNVVSSGSGVTADFAPSAFTTQEIRVYQTHDGRQLLQVNASPVQRFGGNFDLSPDGLRLAVIRGDAVDVHSLPHLTEADEAAIRRARTSQPEDMRASVKLASHKKQDTVANASAEDAAKMQIATPLSGTQVPIVDLPTSSEPIPVEAPRKAPTLYTLPTDKPEGKPE